MPLSNDRRHQVKVSGVYITPWKLSIGLAAYYRTGTPLTRYGFSDAYTRYEFFLTERGAEGRTPDNYEADLHFGYPVAVGPVTINILVDVFNILNAQRPVLLDRRVHSTSEARFDERVRLTAWAVGALHRNAVDVVVLNDAPPGLARHIVTTGRRIYCCDTELDHAFVRDVQLRAADLEPFLRRARRIKLDALAR